MRHRSGDEGQSRTLAALRPVKKSFYVSNEHTMSSIRSVTGRPDRALWLVVSGGVVALAVAMGIGRFAFTPLLPLVLRDGTLDAAGAAEWAAANYIGYLIGALTAGRFARNPRLGLQMALVGVAVTTLAAAAIGEPSWSVAGIVLRGLAGVFSAWALVCTSSWALAELARHQAPRLGAWIYCGVGLGIALAGILAWLGGQQPAPWLWLEMGIVAAAGAVFVRCSLRAVGNAAAPTPAGAGASSNSMEGTLPLVICYGAFGFGYIVPATFLPAMARQLVADPLVFGLTWPVFGLAAAISVVVVARYLSTWPRRKGLGAGARDHGARNCAALGNAIIVGSCDMCAAGGRDVHGRHHGGTATRARERVPANPTPLLARMTAAFAAGQILEPLLVRALGTGVVAGLDAVGWANASATVVLLLTAAWLWLGGDDSSPKR